MISWGEFEFLLAGVPLTLALAFIVYLIGAVIGLAIAVARVARLPYFAPAGTCWTEFFRTTPPLVHVTWAFFALPLLTGVNLPATFIIAVALSAYCSAELAEVFRSALQAVPASQKESAAILGLSPLDRFRFVIAPQAGRLAIAPSCNVVASVVKETSLASLLAVPELMQRTSSLAADNFLPLETYSAAALIYFALILPLILLASFLEKRAQAAFSTG